MSATTTAPLTKVRLRKHQAHAVQAAHTALRHTARTSIVMAFGTV